MNDVMLKTFLQLVDVLDQRLSTSSSSLPEVTSLRAKEGIVIDMSESIRRLVASLERQDRLLSSNASAELRYAMAAWCDEMLLARWSQEASTTEANPYVEQRMFGTMEAGEKIFWCIDRALERRSEGDLQMAPVYLTLLALGYRGQYSETETPERLREQMQALCEICSIERYSDSSGQQTKARSVLLNPAPRRRSIVLVLMVIACAIIIGGSLIYADRQWTERLSAIGSQPISEPHYPSPMGGNKP